MPHDRIDEARALGILRALRRSVLQLDLAATLLAKTGFARPIQVLRRMEDDQVLEVDTGRRKVTLQSPARRGSDG